MSTIGTTDSGLERREKRRRRMIKETENFVNDGIRRDHIRQHRGSVVTNRKTDPRIAPETIRRHVERGEKSPRHSPSPGVLVDVPRNDERHLDEELLVPLVSKLSRLVAAPWKGDVLLDLSGVASVTEQFVEVYEWFRRQLMKQQRVVLLYVDGNSVGNPGCDELKRLIRIDGSVR